MIRRILAAVETYLTNRRLSKRYEPKDDCPFCGKVCDVWNLPQIAEVKGCDNGRT